MSIQTPAQSTRAFLEQLFGDMVTRGIRNALPPALSEDLIWTAANTSPLSGRFVGKTAYLDGVLSVLGQRLDSNSHSRLALEQILVDGEGDWATVRFHTEGARGKNGEDFSMSYCWIMRVDKAADTGESARRIQEVVGFYDGVKMARLFGVAY